MSKFAVTLNHHGNYGYVEYDSENNLLLKHWSRLKAWIILKFA